MQNKNDKQAVILFLKKVSLFDNANLSLLNLMAEKIIFNSYLPGEKIIQKGEIGQTMYLIFKGQVKVHDGEQELAKLWYSDFFGELSLLDSEPRSMSVTAIDDTMLGTIDRNVFYDIIKEFPDFIKDVIAALNRRLRSQNEVLIGEYKNKEDKLKELVAIRTLELEQKNTELQDALNNLKKRQQQLIQSEKLASLGQLTAGIAHELQNPLNFVNNFSTLSNDLFKEYHATKSVEERTGILSDIELNLKKINEHGTRADSIIKKMMEHSRYEKSKKQLVNLNQICDDYLNIAFHSMRINTSDFNCELHKEFTQNLPFVNVAPQDLGRVFLNLFNNAFYAVTVCVEIKKKQNQAYLPKVIVSTSEVTNIENKSISISINDNSIGVQDNIADKIFMPFFTTKPPGQGTGLGLSLSYDIIKAHGGDLSFDAKQSNGVTFLITLPI